MGNVTLQAFERTTTERLLLRAVRESDVDAVFRLHGDPEASRFRRSGPLRTLDAARELLALWLNDWAQHGVGYWAVERLEEPGVVVGICGVRHKELEGQQVLNLAYRLSPQLWGSGYATEVSRAALALCREHLPGIPVVALIDPRNTASIRVAQRLGMRLDRVIQYEDSAHEVYVPG
jgi:RimJ/RimL family protein N-acetyltransferase